MEKRDLRPLLSQLAIVLTLFSCRGQEAALAQKEIRAVHSQHNFQQPPPPEDTILLSQKHLPNTIYGDLDGDHKKDTVQIVQNTKSEKTGLKITFGNNVNPV